MICFPAKLEEPEGSCPAERRAGWAIAVVLLLGAAAAITWSMPPGVVLGAPHTDIINQFAAWRAFAADSIRAGEFPLWNPHTYSGQPFLAGFQSGLLYPPNAVFLFLPLSRAINFSILSHLFLAGSGMAYWVSRRGLHPAAVILAGCLAALCGPVLPQVYAGHLSNLCTLAWVPWAFAGFDEWWRNAKRGGLLLAAAAICFQILGGQVQYVFFFGVAALLYAVTVSLADAGARRRALPSLVVCFAVASVLAAAQLLPSFTAAAETVRSGRLEYNFAATFALPPENLLTGIAPGIFGYANSNDPWYWGRCYPWEMSVFVGVGAVVFAAIGGCDRRTREGRWELLLAVLLIGLALGRHLPAYRFLYEYVPGFDRFRGMSKFTFPAALFFILVAARGIDACLRGSINFRRASLAALAGGAAVAIVGAVLRARPEILGGAFHWIRNHPENDFPAAWFGAADVAVVAAKHAAACLWLTAGFAFALGICLWLARRRPAFRWVALAVVPAELAVFCVPQIAATPLSVAVPADVDNYVATHRGDYRVLNLLRPNNGYLLGAPDIWGNDPLVLKRYAEFIAFTQNEPTGTARQVLYFRTMNPLLGLLRCRYVFSVSATETKVGEIPNVLPRALLVSDYRVRSGRDAVLAELATPNFDPTRTVVLESEPSPRLEATGELGTVRVVAATNNTLTLDVDTPRPAILLVSDLYSRDWRVRSRDGSSAQHYTVMPADYVLRAIPLAAGRHELQMEYAPAAFPLGLAVSAIGWLGWLGAVLHESRRRVIQVPPGRLYTPVVCRN